ncbi:MAG: secernin [Chloroflexota bacterium]|nr:secernin [Chloroflexota bacterium]
MCDTAVALGNVTRDGQVYFAKNSDRDVNEAQYLEVVAAADHGSGEKVRCTYIEIPQVAHTHRVLLSKPYWMWGAEMGVNEHGLAIGNEAVFTKLKAGKKPGLIGMDILRLALERAASAEEALHVILDLLKAYGQSGNCALDHGLYYHNAFLMADRSSAWVLETAGEQWAALRVKDFYSISNRITIGSQWDLASDDLVRVAIDRGWCKSKADFHFADCYSDRIFSTFSQAAKRRSCSYEYLRSHAGQIDTAAMLEMLRMHNLEDAHWAVDRSLTEWTVCVHKGYGPVRASQSVASLVCRLSQAGDLHLATGTSAPCLSLFKPIWLDAGLPAGVQVNPGGTYNDQSMWWQHELLHRAVLQDFDHRSQTLHSEQQAIEQKWIAAALRDNRRTQNERAQLTGKAFREGDQMTQEWLQKVRALPVSYRNAWYYDAEWRSLNRKAQIPV